MCHIATDERWFVPEPVALLSLLVKSRFPPHSHLNPMVHQLLFLRLHHRRRSFRSLLRLVRVIRRRLLKSC